MTEEITVAVSGGPESLMFRHRDLAPPAEDEVRVRQTAIGINYVDVYHRTGLYPMPDARVPGVEAVGIIEAVGSAVTGFAEGDRVAYASGPPGAYAKARNLPAGRLIAVPAGIEDRLIAGSLLRGLTAYMLLEQVTRLVPGETILIQAAAGGLGLVLGQWAKRKGLKTIGTVSSHEKARIAAAHGFDRLIFYREDDVAARARELTDGRGVEAVIDGIGGETLLKSLESLRPFGIAASVGTAGGPLPPITPALIANRALTRPSILASVQDPAFYRAAARAWFALLQDGFRLPEGQDYPFVEAGHAHRDLEAGQTIGPVRLVI